MTAQPAPALWTTPTPVVVPELTLLPHRRPQLIWLYVETVFLHVRRFPRALWKPLRAALTMATRDLTFSKVHSANGRQGWLIKIHRMTLSDALQLKKFCNDHADLLPHIYRYDLAAECPLNEETANWFKRHIIVKGCKPGSMMTIGDTQYWHISEPSADVEPGHKAKKVTRKAVAYPGTKFGIDVSRFELRHETTQAVKRSGVHTIDDLLNLNPRELLSELITFVDYDPEPVIRNMVRKTMAERRKNQAHRKTRRGPPDENAHVYERYDSHRFARERIVDVWRRGGDDIETAQGYKNAFGSRAKRLREIDIAALNLPDALWWPTYEDRKRHYHHTNSAPLNKNNNEINETNAQDDLTANTQD